MKRFLIKIFILGMSFYLFSLIVLLSAIKSNFDYIKSVFYDVLYKYEVSFTKERLENVKILYSALSENKNISDLKSIIKIYINDLNEKDLKHYIFVYEISAPKTIKMLINPNRKDLEGKIISLYKKDLSGKAYRLEMYEKALKYYSGKTEYYYVQPLNKKISKKTTYFIYLPKLHWIIASGVYEGNIEKSSDLLVSGFLKKVGVVLAIVIFLFIFAFMIYYYLYRHITHSYQEEVEYEKKLFKLLTDFDKEVSDYNFVSVYLDKILKMLKIDCLVITDIEGHVLFKNKNVYFNKKILKLIDLNKNFQIISFKNKKYYVLIHKIKNENFVTVFESEKTPDIKGIFVLNHIVSMFIIVYERKEYEYMLEKEVKKKINVIRQKDAEIMNNAKLVAIAEVTGNIAHQWKQPLNMLSNIINTLTLDLELSDEINKNELKNKLKIMQDVLKNLSEIINVFQDFYKNDKVKKDICIKDILKNIFFIFNPSGIEIIQNINDCSVYVYKNELEQVILTILSNAKDEFKNRNIKNPKIIINADCDDEKVIISVEDNAGGIDKMIAGKIFDKFFSTKNSSGLGLAISKEIIEKHYNGKIYVINTDLGAKFVIEIPHKEKG